MSLFVFRVIKEDTAGPENVSNPQNTSIQENSTEDCNSSKIALGNNPYGKLFHNFQTL